jgi:outer membrane biosynthesis protein TonB
MQPQNLTTKPVMDIAAPPKAPQQSVQPKPMFSSPPAPLSPQPAPNSVPNPAVPQSHIEVKPAPIAEEAKPETQTANANLLAPTFAAPKKVEATGPHAPVALITITIIVMLVLAALAVIIYMTTSKA